MLNFVHKIWSFMIPLACLVGVGGAMAQAYPSKPITIVVAYPAGGDTDAMARLYAEKLATRLGQPVVVDNRVGASGTIGTAYVSKAAPDGYTLLLAPSTFSIAQLVIKTGSGSSYDEVNGFTPIIQTNTQPLLLAASTASGIKDVKQMVEAAKAKPMSYASPGSGSPMHILGEMFNRAASVKIAQVPYRGAAPAVNDLMGGHVPVTYMSLGPLAPFIASGKVVPLAVASA
jgi:tripartite-type tricarboxylate transporter receptor subunit TctC